MQIRRKEFIGKVVSDKMEKTVVVTVRRQFVHPIYDKVMRRNMRFHAHDERNECHIGDIVKIIQTRPLSKTKGWAVAERIEQAQES